MSTVYKAFKAEEFLAAHYRRVCPIWCCLRLLEYVESRYKRMDIYKVCEGKQLCGILGSGEGYSAETLIE